MWFIIHIRLEIWFWKDFLSHLRARYDQKNKIYESKSENPEKSRKFLDFEIES